MTLFIYIYASPRSNNEDIARRIALPTSAMYLDKIRPDICLYRALGRCLILWGSVTPTETWFDLQIPNILKTTLRLVNKSENITSQITTKKSTTLSNIEAKLAKISEISQKSTQSSIFQRPPNNKSINLLNYNIALLLYMNTMAGLCMGIGLVYAGTGDERAKELILSKLLILQWYVYYHTVYMYTFICIYLYNMCVRVYN